MKLITERILRDKAFRLPPELLQQLASAGVLANVAGVALGQFTRCRVPEGAAYTLRDVLLDHLAPLGVPVVGDLPIGHGERNCAFVWDRTARIRGPLLELDPS